VGLKSDQSGDTKPSSGSVLLHRLNEALFALNISLAFGYGVVFYYFSRLLSDAPTGHFFDFCYYFLRSAARAKDFLHLPDPPSWSRDPSQLSIAVAFLLTAGCVSTLLFLFFRLSAGTSAFPIMAYTTGAGALLILPAQLIYFNILGGGGIQWSPGVISSILFSSMGVLIGLSSLSSRVWTIPLPATLFLGLFFPGLAGIVLTRAITERTRSYSTWAYMVLVVATLCWIVWSVIKRNHLNLNPGILAVGPLGNSTRICIGVAGAILLVLWAPGRDYSLMKAKDRESLRIELFHSGCFGSCPVYTITVHGNGEVDYLGRMDVKECGKRSDSISEGQLLDILRELDQVHFFALEDRAFLWPPDVPSVWVTVNADGKTKRVAAPKSGAGPKDGAFATFVRAAGRIDEIVGSEKWIEPKGYCDERRTAPNSN
jgi:hypothetical protein